MTVREPEVATHPGASKGLVIAWRKVIRAGTADQHAAATVILDDARKSMCRILADDES